MSKAAPSTRAGNWPPVRAGQQRDGRRHDLARLARHRLIASGKHLKAGDVILTGSVHPPQFLPSPGVAKTEFVGLGGASITVK